MSNGERYTGSAERTEEVERAAAERSAELHKQSPETERLNKNREVMEARLEANREAKNIEDYLPPTKQETQNSNPTILNRSASYKQTLNSIQSDMSVPSRLFSKLIHNKIIDKTSDVIANTIARPNAILSGAMCAFILVLGLYALAKYVGFALYGSETIAVFIIGWLLGLLFDLFRNFFKKRH